MNWASHVILLNSKLPLGERYWLISHRQLPMVGAAMFCKCKLKPTFSLGRLRQESEQLLSTITQTTKRPCQLSDKDPYIFDMMGQTDKMAERDVERQLVSHITKYLWNGQWLCVCSTAETL